MPGRRGTLPERFWVKVDKSGECWLWLGTIGDDGYGRFARGSRADGMVVAHKMAWTLVRGPVPPGLQLDHLCRNRACVRPDHLEPVTQQENVRRGIGVSAMNARKTGCPKGHPYDDINTYVTPGGGRQCRTCNKAREAARYQARKAAA
jgi:hypothetical protein